MSSGNRLLSAFWQQIKVETLKPSDKHAKAEILLIGKATTHYFSVFYSYLSFSYGRFSKIFLDFLKFLSQAVGQSLPLDSQSWFDFFKLSADDSSKG